MHGFGKAHPFITQLGEEMAAQSSYINTGMRLGQHGVCGGDDAVSSALLSLVLFTDPCSLKTFGKVFPF